MLKESGSSKFFEKNLWNGLILPLSNLDKPSDKEQHVDIKMPMIIKVPLMLLYKYKTVNWIRMETWKTWMDG